MNPRALIRARVTALAWFSVALAGVALGCSAARTQSPNVQLAATGEPDRECLRLLDPERDRDESFLRRAAEQALFALRRSKGERLSLANTAVTAEDLERTLTILLAALAEDDWVAKACAELQVRPIHPAAHLAGYYQPILSARRSPDEQFRFPVYGVRPGSPPAETGKPPSCLSRQEAEASARVGSIETIGWLDDAADSLLLEIQGSALLRYADGRWVFLAPATPDGPSVVQLPMSVVRAGADGKRLTAERLRAYFRSNDDARSAFLQANPCAVLFRRIPNGPIGAMGALLVGGRSAAANPATYPFGTLLLVASRRQTDGDPLGGARLVIAQDSNAIVRAPDALDVYVGTGSEAGELATQLDEEGDAYVLLPKNASPSQRGN